LLLVLSSFSLFSQQFDLDWSAAVGSGSARVYNTTAFARGGDGMLYGAGRFDGGYDLDGGPDSVMLVSGAGSATFLVAYDSTGQAQWAHRLPVHGEIRGLSTAPDGSVFAVGMVTRRGDWNPGPGVAIIGDGPSASGYTHGFLLKFNAAGEFLWIRSFGDEDIVELNDVVVTPGGSVVVTGYLDAPADLDPSANVAMVPEGAVLARYNLDGELIWAKGITGGSAAGAKIDLDGQGHLLLTGEASVATDFDPGPGVYQLGPTSARIKAFVAKYDYAGQLMWANRITNANYPNRGVKDIIADGQGGAWICIGGIKDGLVVDAYSNFTLNGNGPGAFVLHYDAGGRYQSGFRIPSQDWVVPKAMAADGLGGIWVTGECSGGTDLDPGTNTSILPVQGYHDIFLARYSASGALLHQTGWGTNLDARSIGIASLPGGRCAVLSQYQKQAFWGSNSAVVDAGRDVMGFAFSQHSAQGTLQWAESPTPLGGWNDWVRGIATDAIGNAYLLIQFAGVVDLDPGPNTVLQGVADSGRVALCKFSPSKQLLWTIPLRNCGAVDGNSLALDAAGNIYLQFNLYGTCDFDPSGSQALLSPLATNLGERNMVVARYTPAGQLSWARIAQAGEVHVHEFDVDDQGNSYLLGDLSGAVDVDPGSNVNLYAPDGGFSHSLLQKLDANGNLAWAHRFENERAYRLLQLCINPLGGVYVGGPVFDGGDIDPAPGTTTMLADTHYYAFLHLRDNGSLAWATPHTSSGFNYTMEVFDIDADAAGRFMVVGRASYGWDFDPMGGRYLLYPPDIGYLAYPYLACYDSLGRWVYTDPLGRGYEIQLEHLDVRADGVALVGGDFWIGASFDSTFQSYYYTPVQKTPLAAVYAADGRWLGAAQFPCAYGRNEGMVVHAAQDGGFWVGGSYSGDIDLDPAGSAVYPSRGMYDAYWARYRLCTPPSVSYVETNTPLCLAAGPITLSAGTPAGGTYFGAGVSGNTFTPLVAGQGLIPISYLITDSVGCQASDSAAIRVEVCTESSAPEVARPLLRVFPNPSSGRLSIEVEGLPGRSLSLTLHNGLGQCVHSGTLPTGGGTLALEHLPAGVYMVRVAGAGGTAVTRWVKAE
jgi:Secretion system C-terminal sorting domain